MSAHTVGRGIDCNGSGGTKKQPRQRSHGEPSSAVQGQHLSLVTAGLGFNDCGEIQTLFRETLGVRKLERSIELGGRQRVTVPGGQLEALGGHPECERSGLRTKEGAVVNAPTISKMQSQFLPNQDREKGHYVYLCV